MDGILWQKRRQQGWRVVDEIDEMLSVKHFSHELEACHSRQTSVLGNMEVRSVALWSLILSLEIDLDHSVTLIWFGGTVRKCTVRKCTVYNIQKIRNICIWLDHIDWGFFRPKGLNVPTGKASSLTWTLRRLGGSLGCRMGPCSKRQRTWAFRVFVPAGRSRSDSRQRNDVQTQDLARFKNWESRTPRWQGGKLDNHGLTLNS